MLLLTLTITKKPTPIQPLTRYLLGSKQKFKNIKVTENKSQVTQHVTTLSNKKNCQETKADNFPAHQDIGRKGLKKSCNFFFFNKILVCLTSKVFHCQMVDRNANGKSWSWNKSATFNQSQMTVSSISDSCYDKLPLVSYKQSWWNASCLRIHCQYSATLTQAFWGLKIIFPTYVFIANTGQLQHTHFET